MDATSAQRMERYLRLMPDLTPAQQAAAIHLGHFPASQYVGRDSEQVRKRVASTIAARSPRKDSNRLDPCWPAARHQDCQSCPCNSRQSKPENRRDRKGAKREKAEIQAAVANIPDSMKLPKTDPSRLGTETARAKIDEAQSLRITSVSAAGLPPPETARPLVSCRAVPFVALFSLRRRSRQTHRKALSYPSRHRHHRPQ